MNDSVKTDLAVLERDLVKRAAGARKVRIVWASVAASAEPANLEDHSMRFLARQARDW
jgi:hypothetical protein